MKVKHLAFGVSLDEGDQKTALSEGDSTSEPKQCERGTDVESWGNACEEDRTAGPKKSKQVANRCVPRITRGIWWDRESESQSGQGK